MSSGRAPRASWSDREEATLRRIYEEHGAGPRARRLLPGRTAVAIRHHASILGCARPPVDDWSPAELVALRAFVLPESRTWRAAAQAARRHKLKGAAPGPRRTKRSWTVEEDAAILRGRVPPGRTWIAAADRWERAGYIF